MKNEAKKIKNQRQPVGNCHTSSRHWGHFLCGSRLSFTPIAPG